nr:hypothetical protein [Morchella crassipes]
MALWAKREGGGGPFYIFNFLKKNQNEKGGLPLHHPGLCLHARPVLGLSFLPPPFHHRPSLSLNIFFAYFYLCYYYYKKYEREGGGTWGGGGLGVWVGKPASFPLFYNEKGGGFVVLLNIGGASLYQCMS